MARHDSLAIVLEAATEQLAQAERMLAAANAREREGAGKLEVLRGYRGDYTGRLRATTSGSVADLLNMRAFLDKLETAVGAQDGECARLASETAAAQAAWSEARRRVKSIELLRARRAAEADKKLARSEQKMADEFAARAARNASEAAAG